MSLVSKPARRLSADLLSLGTHCALPDCYQIDFLPFNCDCCNRIFCLAHRTYAAHSCPTAGSKDCSIIVCPICAKAVRLGTGQDPNLAFEEHTLQDCDPDNYAKVHKKTRCPVPGCKERLTSTNTFACKACHSEVCLKHRFDKDHRCKERIAEHAATVHSQRSLRGLLGLARRPQPPSGKAAAAPDAYARGIAQKQRQQQQQSHQAEQSKLGRTVQQHAPRVPLDQASAEVCPACQAKFGTIAELIQHVDVYHADRHAPAASGLERCPHCSQAFTDAVALVQHVEQDHSSSRACVLC